MRGAPFGRYRLVELLGRGGMGEVWRAFDTRTDREVAIKVLSAQFSQDQEYEARFRREAHAAARLKSPHIVPIHDFGEIEGRLFVDMRLIDGHDLASELEYGPLSAERAVVIIEHVGRALNAAHRIGLVHRDVKPSNIMIDEDDFAYLIDFGIARAASDSSLTQSGTAIGTWAYMAPERFTGADVDHGMDVYALACVLCESLTGARPFPSKSLENAAAGHLFTPPPRPSQLRAGLAPAFDAVIAGGMAKDPTQRYQSTRELASAAREALTSVSGRPHTHGAPPRPVDQRPRTDSAPVRSASLGTPAPSSVAPTTPIPYSAPTTPAPSFVVEVTPRPSLEERDAPLPSSLADPTLAPSPVAEPEPSPVAKAEPEPAVKKNPPAAPPQVGSKAAPAPPQEVEAAPALAPEAKATTPPTAQASEVKAAPSSEVNAAPAPPSEVKSAPAPSLEVKNAAPAPSPEAKSVAVPSPEAKAARSIAEAGLATPLPASAHQMLSVDPRRNGDSVNPETVDDAPPSLPTTASGGRSVWWRRPGVILSAAILGIVAIVGLTLIGRFVESTDHPTEPHQTATETAVSSSTVPASKTPSPSEAPPGTSATSPAVPIPTPTPTSSPAPIQNAPSESSAVPTTTPPVEVSPTHPVTRRSPASSVTKPKPSCTWTDLYGHTYPC